MSRPIIAVIAASLLAQVAQGAVISYHRLEGDTTSEVNSPALDGSFQNSIGLSAVVAGAFVFDPVANTSVANTGSMEANIPANATGNAERGRLVISDNALLEPSGDFTHEMFFQYATPPAGGTNTQVLFHRAGGQPGQQGIVFQTRRGGANDVLRLNVDYNDTNGANDISIDTGDLPIYDGNWHHVGVTYQEDFSTGVDRWEVYFDYSLEASINFVKGGLAFIPNGELRYGLSNTPNGHDGTIARFDEMRYLDEALIADDFLRVSDTVIPEPSTYLVFGGLALCFGVAGWWRKRRQAA